MDKYYTPAEAAKILSLAPYTVRKWIRQGKINAVKFGSTEKARVRIAQSELERLTKGEQI